MSADVEPKLAPPGAGLPKPELYVARMLFAWLRWTGNRDAFNRRFEKERAVIRHLTRACDAETGAQRVLIRRPPGLEDSSRYWSVWMTLDHLRIMHGSINQVVEALVKGVTLDRKASTAAVKPSPLATNAVVPEFEKSCDTLLATVAATSNLKTLKHFEHPWFGPLDAAAWHAMAAMHLGLHRVQIERILKGLPAVRSAGGLASRKPALRRHDAIKPHGGTIGRGELIGTAGNVGGEHGAAIGRPSTAKLAGLQQVKT